MHRRILALVAAITGLAGGVLCAGPPDVDRDRFPSSPSTRHISLSSGAVQVEVDRAWELAELPAGRSIRLYLTPGPPPETPAQFRDGIWMAYHWDPVTPSPARTERESTSRRATQLAGRGSRIEATRPVSVSGYAAVAVELSIPAIRASQRVAFHGEDRPQARRGRQHAVYTAVRMPSGWFELYSLTPWELRVGRQREIERLIREIHLSDPIPVEVSGDPRLADARPIVGIWKAQTSTLELSQQGRVTIAFDRGRGFRLDEQARLDYEKPVRELAGTFASQEDVIFIDWDDSSRSSFRWKLDRGRLLLTDDHGRTSRLQRIIP